MYLIDQQIKKENLEVDLGILNDENILIIVTDNQNIIEDIFNSKVIKNCAKVIVFVQISKRFGKVFYSRYVNSCTVLDNFRKSGKLMSYSIV